MPEEPKVFPISPTPPLNRLLTGGVLFVPIALFALLLFTAWSSRSNGRPGDQIGNWIMGGVLIMIVPVLAGTAWFLVRAKATTFEVDRGGLRVRSPFYARTFARELLKLDEARIVEKPATAGFAPVISAGPMLGVNLPGICLGNYKLNNRSVALLYVTYPFVGPIIHLPTTGPHDLILSPTDPSGFLEELRKTPTSDGDDQD